MSHLNSHAGDGLTPAPLMPIAHHIQDVLRFLALPSCIDETSMTVQTAEQANTQPLELLKVLLIGETQATDAILQNLPTSFTTKGFSDRQTKIQSVAITPTEFLALPYTERFDLGVLIDDHTPSSKHLAENKPHDVIKIANRLRDLFADQSLLYLPATNKINLRQLGFVQSEAFVSKPKESKPNKPKSHWQAWQFNLYDYKPTPNWLNAKYWANPENFDKYRW